MSVQTVLAQSEQHCWGVTALQPPLSSARHLTSHLLTCSLRHQTSPAVQEVGGGVLLSQWWPGGHLVLLLLVAGRPGRRGEERGGEGSGPVWWWPV